MFFVGSTLSYFCEVCGFTKSEVIERIHLNFCKCLLKVGSMFMSGNIIIINTWANNIKSILDIYGFSHVWLNPTL